jgi:hypothetical protein
MLFSLRSMVLFSSAIAASVFCDPDPVVMPGSVFTPKPEDCAVPALLVPGAGGVESRVELPAPDGTPLTPAVPTPTEPALGEPTVLPAPDEDPLAAPPALPPLAPPVLCADEMTVDTRIAIAPIAAVTDALFIANLLF